ncbi:MAG: imidazole glycerol phosphate synthase subunit HisH [Myxococcota bacterium]
MSSSPRIAVVDYGAGNLRSVEKALLRSGLDARVTGDPADLRDAAGVVLPGAGAFADAMGGLAARGLDEAVREHIGRGRPYLGLCLGLQVLFEEGDEHGVHAGLAVLPGRVERFADVDAQGHRRLVPHIGWNRVDFTGDHPMRARLPDDDCFYFVHSYRAVPTEEKDVAGRADYGGPFAAAVARDNVFAVQFHPEKSQGAGKRLLDAFAGWIAA